MEGWIGSLAGIFDGYNYTDGPIHVYIENKKITDISRNSITSPEIDGRGLILTPTFVDGHTHLIFAGTRFNELSMKLEGKSYNEILAKGGGIQSTVQSTRKATDDELRQLVTSRLDSMLRFGSLAVEVKSGYGLSHDHEIRLLEILNSIDHAVEIIPTFGGAHVIPKDMKREHYIDEIIDEMLPVVKKKSLGTSTDVFCDKGAFTVDETFQIFDASTKLGLPVRVHAEELMYTGVGKESSEKYELLSADHLLHATQNDFEILAKNNTVAMLMPLAPFGLFSKQYPTGFHDTNVVLGLGSDFNPNNWALNIQSAIRMATYLYKISPTLALKAVTTGSYQGVYGQKRNPLGVGSSATFLLIKSSSLAEFCSKFGQNLIYQIYKDGNLLYQNNELNH